MANIDPYGVKASQLSTDGQAFTGHHLIRKVMVMHSAGADAIVKFYDLDTAPTGGEPYYAINAYGKGVIQVDMPDPGMVFFNGLYLDIPADCVVTTWYEAL